MAPAVRRIAILAGGGSLPLEFARSAAARGELAGIVAIDGFADADFTGLPLTRVGMGQVGRLLRAFEHVRATDIVIIGPVKRPDLRRIRPDLGFFLALPAVLRILSSGGDDGVLSGVVRFFEGKGYRVLGPADVAPETLAPEAVLTTAMPAVADERDMELGFRTIRLLGDLDVGQAVIVADGRIEAIEGAEGTDRMLARVRESRQREGRLRSAGQRAGILVKRPKPGQELRVDMPSIGPGTVTAATGAGLRGIAVHAGNVLVAGRAEVRRLADAAGIFVAGVGDEPDESGKRRLPVQKLAVQKLRVLGSKAPAEREARDALVAAEVASRLEPLGCGRAVTVAGGHVLAVEAGGEGAAGVIARTCNIRNRYPRRAPKPAGALYLAAGEVPTEACLAGASRARLAGVVLSGGVVPREDVIARCDSAGMFLAMIEDETRTVT